jgi:PP-loop superfamily ATP-utilizing enzyme
MKQGGQKDAENVRKLAKMRNLQWRQKENGFIESACVTMRKRRKKNESTEIERKKEYRDKLKQLQQIFVDKNNEVIFQSRTQKHRALKEFKENLPQTPRKREDALSSYLDSKTVQQYI